MTLYPNFRVTVEAIILRDHKVLLVKRAGDCAVAPGVWHVPAGKAKYEELPTDAVVRECKEETGYDVRILKELGIRTFKTSSNGEAAYRLAYTYLLQPQSQEEPTLNNEHTEYAWVGPEALHDPKYGSLLEHLRSVIEGAVFGPTEFIVHVHFHVKPDCKESFVEATLDNVVHSREETGVTSFDLLQEQDDPFRFMLVEVYKNPEAQLSHRETAHYRRWREKVMDMLVEPYNVEKYCNVINSK